MGHLPDAIPSSVRRSQIRRVKKTQEKQQRKLLEIVVPSNVYPTVSTADINADIFVFDGGNSDCPPITPPKGVQWRRLHVSDLFIQDDLRDDIGLTFHRMNGCLPFIRLPQESLGWRGSSAIGRLSSVRNSGTHGVNIGRWGGETAEPEARPISGVKRSVCS